MKIENPFESGHIKNYVMAYVAVVVIMVLFFIASTLWRDATTLPKKEFEHKSTNTTGATRIQTKEDVQKNRPAKSRIKLLEKGYE